MCKINLLGENNIVNKTIDSYAIHFKGKYRLPRFGSKFNCFIQNYIILYIYTELVAAYCYS